MESKAIEILFGGRKEIIHIMDTGGDIVKYLTRENPICPLIGTEIALGDKLGKGAFGTVFLIDFPGKGRKQYAVKRNKIKVMQISVEKDQTYVDAVKIAEEEDWDVDPEDIYKYNGIADPNEKANVGKTLYVPQFMINTCMHDTKFKRMDGKGYVFVPKGSLICQNTTTEIIISLLIGELYRSGASINFIDVFYFGTCRTAIREIRQFTFMEKIDTTLKKIVKGISNEEFEALYIQIIHAISVYQNRYAIIHGDLHLDNIFIEKVKPETTWNGQKLIDASELSYSIFTGNDERMLYLPIESVKYLAKIGDWGLSVKYPTKSSPIIIGDDSVMNDGVDQNDGNGPSLPNFYNKAYDAAFVTIRLFAVKSGNLFIRKIVLWMLGLDINQADKWDKTKDDKIDEVFMAETGLRPNVKKGVLTGILKHVTPEAILTNVLLMGKYLNPKGAKILNIGTNREKDIVERAIASPIKSIVGTSKIDPNYMKHQTLQITIKTRNILVNWMAQVVSEIGENNINLLLISVALVDKYLSAKDLKRNDIQRLGCAALYLTFKDNKRRPAKSDFVYLSKNSFNMTEFNEMINRVDNFLDEHGETIDDLPNPYFYLDRGKDEAKYDVLMEQGLGFTKRIKLALSVAAAEYDFLKYDDKIIAICATGVVNFMLDYDIFPENFTEITGYTFKDIKSCLVILFLKYTETMTGKINQDIRNLYPEVKDVINVGKFLELTK